MRRALKFFVGALLAFCLLLVLLVASLYLPPVQRWAVDRLTAYLERETGWEVTIGHIHLSPLLDLSLGQVSAQSPPQDGGTAKTDRRDGTPTDAIAVRHVLVDLDLTRLLMLRVGVEAVELKEGCIRMNTLVESLQMNGKVGCIRLKADEIDFRRQKVRAVDALLDGCVLDIMLRETPEDTTESKPVDWQIDVRQLAISNSRLTLQGEYLPFIANAAIRNASLDAGDINLGQGVYRVGKVSLSADSLSYDVKESSPTDGFDVNHLSFSDAQLEMDGLRYSQQASELDVLLKRLAFCERSGFRLESLAGNIHLDSTRIDVRGLDLQTPHSSLYGEATAPLLFTPDGAVRADLHASVGSEDVTILAAAYMPDGLAACYPVRPLRIGVQASGCMDSLALTAFDVVMPNVIDARVKGELLHLMDSTQLGADLKWDIATMDLRCINRYLGLDRVHLPKMVLHADTRLRQATRLTADALLLEGNGKVHLNGNVDLQAMTYRANARIADLQLHDFLPGDSLYLLTAGVQVSGHGTDALNPRTKIHALLNIDHLGYASWNLDSIRANCKLEEGKASFELDSRNPLLGMFGCADAVIRDRKLTDATFSMDLCHIDLHAFRLARKPLSASMVMHIDGASDFQQTHRLAARMEAVELTTADSVYHPLDLVVDMGLTPEAIRMKAEAGDLALSVASDQGIDSLLFHVDRFGRELQRQTDSLRLNQDTLRTLLPHINASLDCGQRNPIANILRHATGYTFRDLSLRLLSSPASGLSSNGHMYALNTGAILIDSIRWRIEQQEKGLTLDARVANGPKNRIVTFQSRLLASLTPTGAEAAVQFLDAQGRKSIDAGLALDLHADGMRVRLTPLNPVIAYRNFQLNADNFVSLARSGRIEALVNLLADDGTGLKLYTTPNEAAQQDISLSVHHFNVGELTQSIPFLPDIRGFLQGDIHYMQADSTNTISTDLLVERMTYNGVLLGNIGLNGAYFPNADGSHFVDGFVTQNGEEILLLNGEYREKNGRGWIGGQTSFQRLPFAFLNAFMPEGPFAMSGYAWGDFTVNGNTDNPVLNGQLRTDSLHIRADSYNVNLRVTDHTVTVKDSRLDLGRMQAFAAGKTPLVLDGNIDFSNLEHVELDINVRADNYQLINAPKRQGALAYGKVFVNLGGRLWGTPDDLQMRGRLDVLGSTDVSVVLTDTPISVDDPLADIVTFSDFTDTIPTEPSDAARQNIDIQMNVGIAETAQIHCFLSDAGNDFIDLQGGGELTLSYDTQNDMQLWGRYTIGKGTMRYSLMAIPLNDFRIAQGSYVEFQGNMMNPRLSINASERVRSTVTENSVPRNVAFNVGLAISRTLDDMGLEFTLEAPEDLTVQNQLSGMTQEERGRVAVTMLVTGMYVTDDTETNGGFNYANTLNAYLQSAINEIAGKALSTVDVNFGIAEGTSDVGTSTTDYSFSFAKRFWGNRISVIVGGKVSSGRDAVNNGQTIIDNISIEYRLDKSASRYVNIFYDRNYESLLEGQVTKMGGGIVLRKKADRLGELFIFRKNKKNTAPSH